MKNCCDFWDFCKHKTMLAIGTRNQAWSDLLCDLTKIIKVANFAKNLKEARKILDHKDIYFVLIDTNDDGVDSYDIYRTIKEQYPQLKTYAIDTLSKKVILPQNTCYSSHHILDRVMQHMLNDFQQTKEQHNSCHMERLELDLLARMKELRCIYAFFQIIENPYATVNSICKELVDMLPLAFRCPEQTTAKISLSDYETYSKNFAQSPNSLVQKISSFGEVVGSIEVFLTGNSKVTFSKEEHNLLRAIVSRLGYVIERHKARKENETQRVQLYETNQALRKILGTIKHEKDELKEDIYINIERNIMPIITRLKNSNISSEELNIGLSLMEESLMDICNNLGRNVGDHNLSPTELRVCQYIKTGKSAKDIATIMGISINTVQNHSRNIRSKLGITNKGISLKKFF